jgi:hypothetical protein
MACLTTDLARSGLSRYYTVSRLGPKRSLTPEGYLLCEAVPVARTGEMLYAEGEIFGDGGGPIKGDQDGIIRVSRGPEELFREETLASFEGKPITLEHPDQFMSPENIRQYQVGTMAHVRRGEGMEDDLMLADLLITDAAAIKAVQEDGIEEVSNGYEAEYAQEIPGYAVQHNILGNHVALVKRGRCGPRCAIGDEAMTMNKKKRVLDKLMRAFKAEDADEVEKIAKEVEDDESEENDNPDKKTEDTLHKILDRLTALDAEMAEIKKDMQAKDEKGDDDDDDEDDGETADDGDLTEPETAAKLDQSGITLYTGDTAEKIVALAEILAPGVRLPTFDGKTTDAQRAAALCQCQRKALDTAYKTDAGRELITPFLGTRTPNFQKLPAALVHAAFIGAANMLKARNNDAATRPGITGGGFGKTVDVATLNAKHRAFWAQRAGPSH